MNRVAILQLVRECPPGYGGGERVAHELAMEWLRHGIDVTTFCLQPKENNREMLPYSVPYKITALPRLSFGKLLLPLPSWGLICLLNRKDPLHVHLPCPAMLVVSILARLRHPKRFVHLHWHAFLQPPPGLHGLLIRLYQWLALRWVATGVQAVITTSPVLACALEEEGVPPGKIHILPCCLGRYQEESSFRIALARRSRGPLPLSKSFRLLFIGRLESYKRVDWLIQAFSSSGASHLDIVGDGSRRRTFERLAAASQKNISITFHGRLDEKKKQTLMHQSHLLILPADSCNEAFGIVQIEAMACGVPALALDCPRSGAAWVGRLKHVIGFPKLSREELTMAIDRLVDDQDLWMFACDAAEKRYSVCFARSNWQEKFAAHLV
jgi:glycosyltransferase involved in cell wall biosynthesis